MIVTCRIDGASILQKKDSGQFQFFKETILKDNGESGTFLIGTDNFSSGTRALDFLQEPGYSTIVPNKEQMTLFQIGDDLSNEFCVRTMKTSRFDVYTLNENQNIKIKHYTRRGPSEQIGESTYIVGVAYDSFNVWIHNGKQPDGSFLESCVAEDVKSFEEAFSIAQNYS